MTAGGEKAASSAAQRDRGVRSHKVVFLGESGTGKTSIIRQFMYRSFDQSYQATVGMDFVSKLMTPEGGGGHVVRLQLWDTAGQERFRALIPGYLRDCSACVVVYDVTSRASFEGVRGWVGQALQDRGPNEVVVALVGNKVDLEAEQRQVETAEGTALAAELGIPLFYEASARTADRVDSIFDGVALALPADVAGSRCLESDEEIVLEPMLDLVAGPGANARKMCEC